MQVSAVSFAAPGKLVSSLAHKLLLTLSSTQDGQTAQVKVMAKQLVRTRDTMVSEFRPF